MEIFRAHTSDCYCISKSAIKSVGRFCVRLLGAFLDLKLSGRWTVFESRDCACQKSLGFSRDPETAVFFLPFPLQRSFAARWAVGNLRPESKRPFDARKAGRASQRVERQSRPVRQSARPRKKEGKRKKEAGIGGGEK